LIYRGNGITVVNTGANTGTAAYMYATTVTQMKAYRMRLKLKGKASVYVKTSFNIDKLFYNEVVFDLDEFVSYVFGDIYFIYSD
jgi:hypothetical protein